MVKRLMNSDTLLGGTTSIAATVLLLISYHSSRNAFLLPGDAPPFLVVQILLYAGLALALGLLARGLMRGGHAFGRVNWGATGLMVALLVIMMLLFERAGYLLVVPLGVLGACLILGYRKPVALLAVSVGVPVLTYFLLARLADMPLPKIPGLEY